MTNQIGILIADDHAVVRRGISTFLKHRPGLKVVGEACNGQEAVEQCGEVQPDIVLMDLRMPVMDGVAATRLIHGRFPSVRVIALTTFQEKELVHDALEAGAISYLLKNVSGDELAEAIRRAYEGRPTLAPEALEALVHPPAAEPTLGDDLTPREREVLALLVKGMSNDEIAARLSVSHATAKAHVSSILSKLGVSTRTEATALALENKLLCR